MARKKPARFDRYLRKAKDYATDKDRLSRALDEAWEKALSREGVLEDAWEELTALFRLVRAWRDGTYSQVSMKTVTYAIAAILYFLSPFDLIPDMLFFIGFVDDVAVITFTADALKKELDRFRQWEKK